MLKVLFALVAVAAVCAGVCLYCTESASAKPPTVFDFKMKDIDGKDIKLKKYKGNVLLVVNTASKCGYTPQYESLQTIYDKYSAQGFYVLGFPANNFGGQEPGTEAQIKEFCSSKYNVTFPMTSKISVKGDDQHALYKFLTHKDTNGDFAGDIEWNFAKFLVDRNGNVMARFASKTTPDDPKVTGAVEKALAAETATAAKIGRAHV